MAQQDGFLHVQRHRGAAGDFVLPCKGRRREKNFWSLAGSFACSCASPMEKVIERRLGWQNVWSSSVADGCLLRTCSCYFWVSHPGEPETRMEHTVFLGQSYRVGQVLAERSDAEMGCVGIFVAQDTRCMSAFSLILDAYGVDFPLQLSRVNEDNLAFLVPVLALPHAGEDAKKDLREDRWVVLYPCPVSVH